MPFFNYYTHTLSPFLWEWGNGWGIRYYGLAYLLGFLAFYGGMILFYKWKWSSLPPDRVADLVTWVIAGVLIGGRLGYCLFYDFEGTIRDPIGIIAFWRGGISGMSSHGGMLGVILALSIYARKTRTDPWILFDHAAILTTIGIFFGRIANFINGELWGRPTDVPWAVLFPRSPLREGTIVPRHPSQLYEALGEGLLLGILLFFFRSRGITNGKIGILFLIFYGFIRIFLETFREPDEQIGYLFRGITLGQLLSIGLIVFGIGLWTYRSKKGWPKQE